MLPLPAAPKVPEDAAAARAKRLAAALRENLRRRKSQARARALPADTLATSPAETTPCR